MCLYLSFACTSRQVFGTSKERDFGGFCSSQFILFTAVFQQTPAIASPIGRRWTEKMGRVVGFVFQFPRETLLQRELLGLGTRQR